MQFLWMPPGVSPSHQAQSALTIGFADAVERDHRRDVDPFVGCMKIANKRARHLNGNSIFADKASIAGAGFAHRARRLSGDPFDGGKTSRVRL